MKKPIALTLLYGGFCMFLYFLDDLPVGLPPVAGAPPRVMVVPPNQPEPEPTAEPEPEPRPEPEPEPTAEPEPEPRPEPEPGPEPEPSNAVTVDDSPFPPAPSAFQSPPERGVTASNAVTVDDSPFPLAPPALQSLPGGSRPQNNTAIVDDSPFPPAPSAPRSESGRRVSTDNAATVDHSPFRLISGTPAGRSDSPAEVLIELDDDNFPNRIGDPCPPAYPPAALRAGIEGTVVLMLRIDRAGVPEVIDVLRSIPVLDDAAIDAAHQCRYEPMTSQDGNPVAGVGPWEVEFLVPTTSR